ncbi:MAG: hypothetical protein MI922_01280 [Bacteroidales bacterium]|nr:hypothetical protein [Bacteroidales bacterium]
MAHYTMVKHHEQRHQPPRHRPLRSSIESLRRATPFRLRGLQKETIVNQPKLALSNKKREGFLIVE